jgi:hypothetical protein
MSASSGPEDTRALYIARTFSSPRFFVEIRRFFACFSVCGEDLFRAQNDARMARCSLLRRGNATRDVMA